MARNKNGSVVHRVEVKSYSAGEEAHPNDFDKGDFILTHSDHIFSKLIRFGQSLRFVGAQRPFAHWSHAALIVDKNGTIIEAIGAGVVRNNLTKYRNTEYHLVHLNDEQLSPGDRYQVAHFGEWSLGEPWAVLTAFSLAFSLLSGLKFSFGFDGQTICSGLVARALERTNIIFDRSPSHILPADLANYFSIYPQAVIGANTLQNGVKV
jgi:hypothetical protein